MGKPKRKANIRFRQSIRIANIRNNAGVIGHPPLMNNAAVIKVRVKPKSSDD